MKNIVVSMGFPSGCQAGIWIQGLGFRITRLKNNPVCGGVCNWRRLLRMNSGEQKSGEEGEEKKLGKKEKGN